MGNIRVLVSLPPHLLCHLAGHAKPHDEVRGQRTAPEPALLPAPRHEGLQPHTRAPEGEEEGGRR